MILNFSLNNNFFNITVKNKELLFDANLLNFIFINQDDIHTLSIVKKEEPDVIKDLIEKNDLCFVFTFQINNDIIIPTILEQYKFFYLPYIKLGYFWYGIIKNGTLRDEGIKDTIEDDFSIELNKNNIFENNIEDDFQKLNKEIDALRNDINSLVIRDLDKKYNTIQKSYFNLNIFIEQIQHNYKSIFEKTNSKIKELKFLEYELENKIIQKNKNSLINNQLDQKKIYLLNLQKYIDEKETKNKTILDKINNLNGIIDNKTLIVKKLDIQISQLVEKQKKLEIKKNNKVSSTTLELEKIFKKKDKDKNIAVCIHLYNYDIFDEFQDYLKNLKNVILKYDLYINIVLHGNDTNQINLKNMVHKIRATNTAENLFITCNYNKGLDIGGFLKSFDKMIELGKKYDSIIKIHTKTNNNWRFAMMYSLLGSEKIIKHNLELLKKDKIGMIGNVVFNINLYQKKQVINYLLDYMSQLNISRNIECDFVPGTIFWIKGGILEKFLTSELINKFFDEFKPNYCGFTNKKTEGRPHAFERLFGVMVKGVGKNVVKFDT